MKPAVDAETDKVLGATMCGRDAAELMQGIVVALKAGATKMTFYGTVSRKTFAFTRQRDLQISVPFQVLPEVPRWLALQLEIHPFSVEEFVMMRTLARRMCLMLKSKTNF